LDETRKKFATYQRDAETNLDYAQSRYYSPMQGRFTSPDEFKGGPDKLFDFEEDASSNPTFYADLENPQSLNKYQYSYNNPYKFNDPTGHCPLCLVVAEIAGTVADVAATVQTLRDPNASRTEKVATVVGTVAGIVAPGGGYGVGAKYVVKALKGKATKTVVNQGVQQTVDQGVKQTTKQTVKSSSKATQKTVHGNSKSSKNSQIVYRIDGPKGVHKYGVGQAKDKTKGGLYKRPQSQVRRLTRENGPGYSYRIVGRTNNRTSAYQMERRMVGGYKKVYRKQPPGNTRPKIE
jgi:RHS repeat-associated protein